MFLNWRTRPIWKNGLVRLTQPPEPRALRPQTKARGPHTTVRAAALLVALSTAIGLTCGLATAAETSAQTTKAPTKVVKPHAGQKPTISGAAVDGQLLTATTGTWHGTAPLSFAYQWETCAKRRCHPIPGATEASYRADTEEIGHTLKATVTAANSRGHASTTSKPTAAVLAGPPVSVGDPTVSGTPAPGETLEASAGEWAGTAPLSYSYQWLSCSAFGECLVIPEATGSTYTVAPLELGSTIEVAVTASNAHGQALASSAETAPVHAILPHSTQLPSISGELLDGQLLEALVGTWTGTGPIAYSYRWELCDQSGENCKGIAEALASGLSIISDFVGKTLRVVVTASNEAGSTLATSPPTELVRPLAPNNSELPSIAGRLLDGQFLNALVGTWTGTGPLEYSYQWKLCDASGENCKSISEALASGLSLISGFVGKTLRVAVTASNEAGSATALSEPSTPVQPLAPIDKGLPSIGGLPEDGQRLSALVGSWEGTGPLSYSYQWQLCNAAGVECKSISEALASGLPIVSGFVGKTLRVAVTATNEAGSATALSEPSTPVQPLAPVDKSLPSISGLLTDGQHLTAQVGSWEGTAPLSYSYQWQLCNAKGEDCNAISEALAPSLGLISGWIGKTVRVAVTASNEAGSATALSPVSGQVAASPPGNREAPSIEGTFEDGEVLSANTGAWSGTGPLDFTYAWETCNASGAECSSLPEATEATLQLASSEVGKTVRVTVTASNEAGSASATSPAGAPVVPAPPTNVSIPAITGPLVVGDTLSVSAGRWAGTTPMSFSYEWEGCGTLGLSCAKIGGATEPTLKLKPELLGLTFRALVTATNVAGTRSVHSLITIAVVL
jgi:uncharacterized protein YukE